MYMYPVLTSNTTEDSAMSRNRSLSASSASNQPPPLLSRGFASLRRAHRRLSNATPQETTEPNHHDEDTVRPHLRLVPNVGLSSRSFVFEIIDKELEPGVMYRIGRFSDRNVQSDRFSFKSKVVSRNHAELWSEQGKDNDAIQLGVDYQGGLEPIYRAVRIRIEINRPSQVNSPFTRAAFLQLRNHLVGHQTEPNIADLSLQRELTQVQQDDSPKLADRISRHPEMIANEISQADIQECCICLYAIAPFQALFVAPCSHVFHFKCLRPIVFQNYPGFSCPLCRNYFDLEASVAVEVEEQDKALLKHQDAKENYYRLLW
ncbi:hypothetical protein CU098_004684 [Rhizopus stolonifer]|uniref:RING-type domain-containing protein n=1 Tax=Rhizopus stolonifer TaxID=4846 RepID=A0A367KGC8_RHIST|nr:hypothetical protein CU098_004684 [Rhizopus stolonifer]